MIDKENVNPFPFFIHSFEKTIKFRFQSTFTLVHCGYVFNAVSLGYTFWKIEIKYFVWQRKESILIYIIIFLKKYTLIRYYEDELDISFF